MAHDVSSISFPLTHRVNVFGLALFVINGTSKAQCDTFLRIWVCQGHINIINEQEADWREMEWQREGWGSKQEGDIYFCQFGDIYLPVILIMIAFAQPLWVMERQFVPRDLERLPTISLVHRDGWMAAAFFFMNTFGKSHLPLLFHAQWQRTRKCTKETSTLICMKTAIFIWVCSSTGLRGLITQKRGKQKWNAIMPLCAQYPELWSFCI